MLTEKSSKTHGFRSIIIENALNGAKHPSSRQLSEGEIFCMQIKIKKIRDPFSVFRDYVWPLLSGH
jgi:hypothetical protein